MNSDADKTWERAIGKLRRKKGYGPLTPEIVKFATGAQDPVTANPPTLIEWGKQELDVR